MRESGEGVVGGRLVLRVWSWGLGVESWRLRIEGMGVGGRWSC